MSEKRRSLTTTEGMGRAPNRAMLRAVGFMDDDFNRPDDRRRQPALRHHAVQRPHLNRLATEVLEGIPRPGGGVGQTFGAPTASDGIMMGHQGMRSVFAGVRARGDRRLDRGRHRRHEP